MIQVHFILVEITYDNIYNLHHTKWIQFEHLNLLLSVVQAALLFIVRLTGMLRGLFAQTFSQEGLKYRVYRPFVLFLLTMF